MFIIFIKWVFSNVISLLVEVYLSISSDVVGTVGKAFFKAKNAVAPRVDPDIDRDASDYANRTVQANGNNPEQGTGTGSSVGTKTQLVAMGGGYK